MFRNWTTVVNTVHRYAALLQQLTFGPEIQAEFTALSKIDFRYFGGLGDAPTCAQYLAETLVLPFLREDLLTGPKLITEWDASIVSDVLSIFIPAKARVTLSGREEWGLISLRGQDVIALDDDWKCDPWFGVEYKIGRFFYEGDSQLCSDREGDLRLTEFAIPRSNPFVPEDFTYHIPAEQVIQLFIRFPTVLKVLYRVQNVPIPSSFVKRPRPPFGISMIVNSGS